MLLVSLVVPAWLAIGPPLRVPQGRIVQLTTFTSRSDTWQLTVRASQRNGLGPAECVMTHDGVRAWELRLSFTPTLCVVGVGGVVAGCGMMPDRSTGFCLLSEGKLLLLDVVAPKAQMRGLPSPRPDCIALSPDEHEAAVRLVLEGQAEWKTYDVSAAREVPERAWTADVDCSVRTLPRVAETELAPVPGKLELLGTTAFPMAVDDPLRRSHRFAVDCAGNVWISEIKTGAVHGFSLAGDRLLTLVPPPEFGQYRPYDWIAADTRGRVSGRSGDRFVEFEADGSVRSFQKLTVRDDRIRLSTCQPDRRWIVELYGARLESDDGASLLRVERSQSGYWFREPAEACSGAPGLALLDRPESDGDGASYLHVFAWDGRAMLERRFLRDAVESMTFLGGDVLLLVSPWPTPTDNWSLELVPRADAQSIEYELPAMPDQPKAVFASTDGKEAWVVTKSAVLHRFALLRPERR